MQFELKDHPPGRMQTGSSAERAPYNIRYRLKIYIILAFLYILSKQWPFIFTLHTLNTLNSWNFKVDDKWMLSVSHLFLLLLFQSFTVGRTDTQTVQSQLRLFSVPATASRSQLTTQLLLQWKDIIHPILQPMIAGQWATHHLVAEWEEKDVKLRSFFLRLRFFLFQIPDFYSVNLIFFKPGYRTPGTIKLICTINICLFLSFIFVFFVFFFCSGSESNAKKWLKYNFLFLD